MLATSSSAGGLTSTELRSISDERRRALRSVLSGTTLPSDDRRALRSVDGDKTLPNDDHRALRSVVSGKTLPSDFKSFDRIVFRGAGLLAVAAVAAGSGKGLK